ncbi:MAG: antitoxin [Candidatus Altiarchaeales archaeon ex4484_2]|nr:MAG: antitoxin [Candidatus Altiarchaeales archaeon ex4484_2]
MEVVCIYEKGVLKPLRKLKMREKERVRVEIRDSVVKETKGVLKDKGMDEIVEEIESGLVL